MAGGAHWAPGGAQWHRSSLTGDTPAFFDDDNEVFFSELLERSAFGGVGNNFAVAAGNFWECGTREVQVGGPRGATYAN